jgi:hypothetical protein
VPVVRPKYAFYSSWETNNAGRFDEELKTIADFINPMGISLAVGEWGQQQANDDIPLYNGQSAVWVLKETTRAIQRAPISAATTWEAYTGTDLQDGLLSVNGVENRATRFVRAGLAPLGYAPSPQLAIRAVQESYDGTDIPSHLRYVFTFYGTFTNPSADVQVQAKCGNDDWFTGSTFTRTASLFQTEFINPKSKMGPTQYCVFRAPIAVANQPGDRALPHVLESPGYHGLGKERTALPRSRVLTCLGLSDRSLFAGCLSACRWRIPKFLCEHS